MSRNLTITYDLKVPEVTTAPALDSSRTLAFPVADKADLKAYYADLRANIEQAKNAVGEELTVWRDAVGNREQAKEPKAAKKDEDEEDEEEEEEENS
ncbi:hypothetical protein PsYK624_157550 [Phanerochaete sordida]|uniref:Uncharacterized protein n=1 Tax=Phanerochaete sordida TaxID=48140 RepID=A0A9P3LLF1_9APHY|nr:hypothetical protein PsYK624_157550 [Phanerochaete sordida]